MRKKISVVIPTYNEEANVVPLSQAIIEVMEKDLSEYDYEILFIDNHSKDNTKALLRGLCANNRKIKAIFNAKNFGQARSPVYGMKQAYGDCVVRMCADFQDPVDMIPKFVREWEKGTKIVIGVKSASKERRGMYLVRECYYRLINKITDIDHIDQFTGFGLYDRKFVDVVRDLHDPMPYLRGIIAELGFDYKAIEYTQPKRRAGKSKNNFYSLYDYAMIGITSYSKVVMRLATFAGFIIGGLSLAAAVVYLVLKLMYWDRFSAGVAPMVIGMFFLGALQLFFIGLLGEYVLSINTRVLDRPLVVEEERLNFDEPEEDEEETDYEPTPEEIRELEEDEELGAYYPDGNPDFATGYSFDDLKKVRRVLVSDDADEKAEREAREVLPSVMGSDIWEAMLDEFEGARERVARLMDNHNV